MGIPQNEKKPPPGVNTTGRGAGVDELISCIKIFGETRPYKFFNVDSIETNQQHPEGQP